MVTRNEQFIYFTTILAVAIPALAWVRYVGPIRESLAAGEGRYTQLSTMLLEYESNTKTPTRMMDQEESKKIQQTRDGIASLIGPAKGVSEIYRGIEIAASQSGLIVDRIEPSRGVAWSTVAGPLETTAFRAGAKSYRIDLHGLTNTLPSFLAGLVREMGFVRIRDVRMEMAANSPSTQRGTVTILVDTFDVLISDQNEKEDSP